MARAAHVFIGWLGFVVVSYAATGLARAQNTSTPAPTGSVDLFSAGCRSLDAKQCDRAIECLSKAVATRPDDRAYALKLAEAYLCAGRRDAAQHLLENLRAGAPEAAEVAVALARVYADGAAGDKAVSLLAPLEAKLDAAGLLVLTDALSRSGQPARSAVVARRGLERFPQCEALWLVRVDQALEQNRGALALRTIVDARQAVADSGALSYRAAQAYLLLGQALGAAEVRTVPRGQVGHVRDGWLLIDARKREDSFLCCPRASALYEIRRAVDAGLDDAAVHCLHARIWQAAGMPERGFRLLKDREALLLETPQMPTLNAFLDAALAAGEMEQAVRYALRAAELEPQRRTEILHDAYVQVAERYNQRGNEPLCIEFLHRAIDLKPDDVTLSLRLADAEWAADRHTAAVQIYERLLRDNPRLAGDQVILERLAEVQAAGSEPRP